MFFLLLASALIVAYLLRVPMLSAWRRARVRRQPFPAEWRVILRQRVPYFRSMPADLQLQLKKRIQVFLAEKPFIGCAGLEVTEEMRVTVAAQACLLLLNRRGDPFPGLRQVLMYPAPFLVDRVHTEAGGVLHERREALSGESWSQGQVILSWADVVDGADVPDDGRNVVIHEFAHQLDQESGSANGAPPLAGRGRRARWARVFSAEYARLQEAAAAGQSTLLDHYGAVNPAEFFAVASETFFERPVRLAEEYRALYDELRAYYRVDPLSW